MRSWRESLRRFEISFGSVRSYRVRGNFSETSSPIVLLTWLFFFSFAALIEADASHFAPVLAPYAEN